MIRALIAVGIASTAVNTGTRLARSVLVGMRNAAAGVIMARAIAVLFAPFLPLLWTEGDTAKRDTTPHR